MDPYEQRLRDEVIYLHSLWHQGPPRKPNPNPSNNPLKHLQPSSSTHFKKEKKRTRGKRGGKGKKKLPESDPPPVSDKPWPCEAAAETPSFPTSGWPNLKPHSTLATQLPSAEEQARFAANKVQQKGLKAAQEFFASHADSDGDYDSDEDMEDEDDMVEDDGCEEYTFFLKVFMEDAELRGFYEKNSECGDFCCLVCGGIGKKVGKRFKDCVALVQHSTAIAKTKKKRAHRAYGQVICKVLGWNINRLPTIVLSLGDPLSHSLSKLGESQGNPDGRVEDLDILDKNAGSENVNRELVLNDNSDVCQKEELNNGSVVSDDLMVCENFLNVTGANKRMEDIERGVSSNVDGNTEGVVNCLEPFKEDGICRGFFEGT
ncbi:hypothetical protein F0562_009016 [Nyssa sinensis]|uniref:Uncharacterized protein n=1 Tax=Nyssa sinensis TaxID=561372 RepID=A0A5J5A6K9_9ASTE|nr:hypothetical protein F0562_009016 [Nyssa sinensis]